MKKQIHYILVSLLLLIAKNNAVAKGNEFDAFVKQVLPFYKKEIIRLQEQNNLFEKNNQNDSLKTFITIDLKHWKYSTQLNKWEYDPSGIGSSDPTFTFTSSKYFYEKNYQTGTETSTTDNLLNDDLSQFNSHTGSNPSNKHLLYVVRITNLPLIYINKKWDGENVDTSISIYENLKKHELIYDDVLECFRKENDTLGKYFKNILYNTITGAKLELIFSTESNYFKFKSKSHRFRFYNLYYNDVEHDEKLNDALQSNLKSFEYNPSFQLDDLVSSTINTISCYLYGDCLSFINTLKTDLARDFWTKFNDEKANFFTDVEAENNSKTLMAMQIATKIDCFEDRNLALSLSEKGLCYIHSNYCGENAFAFNSDVKKAASITTGFLKNNKNITILNESALFDIFLGSTEPSEITIKFSITNKNGIKQEGELAFNNTMSHEVMVNTLRELGIGPKESYFFWLLESNYEDTWANYGYYLDHFYLTSPPAPIQVMAGIILGPVGSAYGIFSGTDMVTGEELSGLDYVFNALDFIPGGSVLGDIGGSLIKKLDIVTSSKVLKIGENLTLYKSYRSVIKGINTTLIGAEKLVKSAEDLVVKVMAWSGNMVFDQGNKLIKLVSKNGLELGAIKGNKLNLSSSAVVTTQGGQTFKLGDDVEVYIDGEKKAEKYEMVKTEDGETGFRRVSGEGFTIRRIDEFIPSSGTQLIGNSNKTTTLLGRWDPDMQVIKGKMLPNEFNVGTEFGIVGTNKGGFNFLNIETNYNPATFFEDFNKPWLQKAIQRGDDIVLATRPINKADYIDAITGNLRGNFAEELKFLVQNNYKPINLSINEWNTIKTWFP